MRIAFTKMQGAGNDFVVLDARSQSVELSSNQARRLADRRYGVGCDQILIVDPPGDHTDAGYRVLNADGSAAHQCGNGARCIAEYVWQASEKLELRLASPAGVVTATRQDDRVAVRMSVPITAPERIPFAADAEAPEYALDVNGEPLHIGAVSMGNPHAVTFVDDVDGGEVERLGAALSTHERFPDGANAGFAQVLDGSRVRLRVYERGVGETLACGSGACAAVVAGRIQGRLGEQVEVHLRGGDLGIYWPGRGSPVTMAGPASKVFEGSIEL